MNQSRAFRQVRDTLHKEAARHNIDINLVKAITATESGFNPRAVSPAGAVGLMQIMPDTARYLGLRDDQQQSVEQKLADPATNARLGVRYLQQMLRQFGGRIDLAVAAYNAGPGAVSKRMAIPPYAETQGYVRTVLAIYETLQPGATRGQINMQAGHFPSRGSTGRKRVVLGSARPASGRSVKPPAAQAEPAIITLKAGALDAAPSALDSVADKIAAADSLAAPELDSDVSIQPTSAP